MGRRRLLLNKRGGEIHPYVEIGGVKWATMNIGAETETDYGLYFQWGDTHGYTSDQVGANTVDYAKPFGWADYKFGNGTTSTDSTTLDNAMTKYNSSDAKTVLELSDDAARLNWGGNWRMPTTEEFATLRGAVNFEKITNYKGIVVNGVLCTDKTDSSKKLFFPATGYCYNGSLNYEGSRGYYWSSSLYSSVRQAEILSIIINATNAQITSGRYIRCYGLPVRPVLDE